MEMLSLRNKIYNAQWKVIVVPTVSRGMLSDVDAKNVIVLCSNWNYLSTGIGQVHPRSDVSTDVFPILHTIYGHVFVNDVVFQIPVTIEDASVYAHLEEVLRQKGYDPLPPSS